MNKKAQNDTLVERAVSSREAVEAAIEKSKDGRDASWERPTQVGVPPIPKWGEGERKRAYAGRD